MRILLIAGHGGTDCGACAFGKKEADLTRELVPMIRNELRQYDVQVDQYNPQYSAYHDIIACGKKYNFKPYDYVLEVHFNAYRQDPGNGKTMGTEIYVTPTEKITTAEEAIVRKISALGLKNRGVKRGKLAVILRAKAQGVSAALLEVCFMDDGDDMRIYNAKKQQIAKAIADGIAEGYKLKKKGGETMLKKNVPSSWAKEAWGKATQKGIIDGLRPHDKCTREEVVTMLYRLGLFK